MAASTVPTETTVRSSAWPFARISLDARSSRARSSRRTMFAAPWIALVRSSDIIGSWPTQPAIRRRRRSRARSEDREGPMDGPCVAIKGRAISAAASRGATCRKGCNGGPRRGAVLYRTTMFVTIPRIITQSADGQITIRSSAAGTTSPRTGNIASPRLVSRTPGCVSHHTSPGCPRRRDSDAWIRSRARVSSTSRAISASGSVPAPACPRRVGPSAPRTPLDCRRWGSSGAGDRAAVGRCCSRCDRKRAVSSG